MAVVIGSASIKITALTEDLKRDIARELNDALGDIHIDANPLKDLNDELRTSGRETNQARDALGRFTKGSGDADRETSKLHKTMVGLHGVTRGLGAVFGYLLPNMTQVHVAGRTLITTLDLMTKATAAALVQQAALAGTGGLLALASALSTAAGAALVIPAALGAGVTAVVALTVGLQGMGDALKVVGDTAKFNEAIKDLSPNARAFAVAVHDMLPQFKELRLQVQDRLFAGLGQDFSEIGKVHLPIVQRGLEAMARSLNEGAKGFTAFAREQQTVSDLGTLFANSSLGAHFLAQAVQPVLGALRDIGTVGSEFLPGLADGFAGAAQRFEQFIAHARETGRLKEIMASGLSALGDIFTILGNIGSIIGSVLRAGQTAGAGFLATAKDITGELAQWAKSTQGQAAFVDFLSAAKQAASALMPILGSVIQLVAHQVAPILANIATTVGPSVKIVLDAIGRALEAAKPGIAALARGFASFLTALAPALPAISRLANVLGETLGKVLSVLGPIIANVATAIADQLAVMLPRVLPAVLAIARAFGDLLVAMAPLIPIAVQLFGPFVEAGGILEAFVPIVEILVDALAQLADALSPLITAVADVLVDALNALAPLVPVITDAILQLAPAFVRLVQALLPLIEPLAKLLAVILPPLIELFVRIVVPVVNVAAAILNVLVPAITFLLDIVISVVGGVTNWFSNLGGNITAIFSSIGSFFTGIWNTLKDTAITSARAIADGVRNGLSVVGGFFANAFEAARRAVVNAFVSIIGGVAQGVESVLSWIRGLPGRILSALGDLGRLLWNAGVKLITGLLDGIKSAAENVFNFMKGLGAKIASLKGPLDVDKRLLVPAGRAIMSGLHSSLLEGFDPIVEFMSKVGPRLAGEFRFPSLPTNVPLAQLPSIRLGSSSIPRGGDGVASPEDIHDAILTAIEGWQVIVSARETASKVNRVNADNRGR